MLPRRLPRRLQSPLLKCLLTLFQLAQLLGACFSLCFSVGSLFFSSTKGGERFGIGIGGFLSSVFSYFLCLFFFSLLLWDLIP